YWVIATFITLLIKDKLKPDLSHFRDYFVNGITLALTFVGFAVTVVYFIYLQLIRSKKKGPTAERANSNLFDDSRFLNEKELDKYYGIEIDDKHFSPIFLKNISESKVNGLIINSNFTKKGEYYFHAGNNLHNLVVGTTGTGKTKFLLIPTILMMAKSKNKPSLVIIDVKGEILEKTHSTITSNGYEAHILDLRSPSVSEHYNPLEIIIDYFDMYLKDKKHNINYKYKYQTEIAKLSELIISSNSEDAFWSNAARNIFKGIIYALLEDYQSQTITKAQFTFATIHNINSLGSDEFYKYFADRPRTSEARKMVTINVLNNYDAMGQMNKTLTSIMSTYVTDFNKFIDSASLDLTTYSDFNSKNIMKKPTAIYILLPDEDKSKYPLASIIVNQIYSLLVTSNQEEGLANISRDTHFLLDEFANLPKFPAIDNWLSIGRERKIFISIFVQAMSQLDGKYGKEYTKTIVQNCNMKIILGLGETQSVDYFKHLFGTYTVASSSVSKGYKEKSESTSSNLQKADLILASQFMKMVPGELYFIELKHNPGHTHVQPIFDKRFNSQLFIHKYKAPTEVKEIENIEQYIYTPIFKDKSKEKEPERSISHKAKPKEADDHIDLDQNDQIGF
ncbi:MAG: type IV secretory system conjugative DNA transfer family protein, partial [Bacilli bacterium]|nr:type IV secretory system conjugative DNA transfer family protein [Bacilli bacterium]